MYFSSLFRVLFTSPGKFSLTFFCCCLLIISPVFAQQSVQELQGMVQDGDTYRPLSGVLLRLREDSLQFALTDAKGEFIFNDLPVGRYTVIVEAQGYLAYTSPSVLLQAGKAQYLHIQLMGSFEEAQMVVNTGTTEITAAVNPAQPVNDMLVVSARSFGIDQVQRFPATVADPGRMAMSFAGINQDRDFNNDVAIRGNSPAGIQWRLEGVEIANPNHFGRLASNGGGLTIFSLSLLDQSDLTTGAFAPEYGNALSGVFDMHFREGNKTARENTLRVGLMGVDWGTEGPIRKGKSSYLVNLRYSTLGVLNRMGFRIVDSRTENTFADASFNLSFQVKKRGKFTFFGTGGISREDIFAEEDSSTWLVKSPTTGLIVGRNLPAYTETVFLTQTGTTGLTYTQLLGNQAYFKAVLALTGNRIEVENDTLNPLTGERGEQITTDNHGIAKAVLSLMYNQKVSNSLTFQLGGYINHWMYNLQAAQVFFPDTGMTVTISEKGSTQQLQPYAQARWRVQKKWTLTGGVHANILLLNQTSSLEPRLAINYDLNNRTALSLAYGLHSQMVPLSSYFTREYHATTGQFTTPNRSLPLIRSHHLVAAFNRMLGHNYRLRIEVYRQWLQHLPVAADSSSYMPMNERAQYSYKALSAGGRGDNLGADLTVERFFSNGWFFLLAASWYDATYTDLRGRTFNTRFNSNYNASLMVAREWKLGKNDILESTLRALGNGGLRYTPADTAASIADNRLIISDSLAYSAQVPDYFRVDARIAWRHNSPNKTSFTLALDAQNVTSHINYTTINYNANYGGILAGTTDSPDLNPFFLRKQSGIVPVVSFQIDF